MVGGVGMSAAAMGEPAGSQPALRRFEFTQMEMAVTVKIVLYYADAEAATAAAKDAFSRVHALNGVLSDYDPESELRRLCDTAGEGKAVPVSPELWKVLEHAQRVSRESDGAFDVTVGPVVRLWRRARRQKELPSPEALRQARELVGYKLVRLDAAARPSNCSRKACGSTWAELPRAMPWTKPWPCSSGTASRGRWWRRAATCGWASRRRAVPVGGWAFRRWTIRRANRWATLKFPAWRFPPRATWCSMSRSAASRYSHVVDPRTGMALTDHCRVMVVGPSGMAADAITKAVGVLGPEKGLKLIDQTPGMAAMVTRTPHGHIEHYESSRWKDLPQVRLKGEEP